MSYLHILVLAIVQGLAELLPVSSSAHVILTEKWLGLDPTAPSMTLLLVMLHTGTMFAVIYYFWNSWKNTYFSSREQFRIQFTRIVAATVATGILGLAMLKIIPHVLGIKDHFEIEQIFGNSRLIAGSLAAAGMLIFVSGIQNMRAPSEGTMNNGQSILIGLIQGLCLPFRGFSRSGATISLALLMNIGRRQAEEFSFALAVVLTPAVVVRELWRVLKHPHPDLMTVLTPSLAGMVFSFFAGLVALKWLSHWLERGKWHYFGIYCLIMSAIVFLSAHS